MHSASTTASTMSKERFELKWEPKMSGRATATVPPMPMMEVDAKKTRSMSTANAKVASAI